MISFVIIGIILSLIFLVLFILFWNWNRDKGTLLYQIYDYLTWLYTYQFWEYDKKVIIYGWLKDNEVMKKRIGINSLIDRLKKDIGNGKELSDKEK